MFRLNVNQKKYVVIALISAFSFLVRILSVSNFKIYKDSFKFLFIAKATENFNFVTDFYHKYVDFQGFNILTPYKWLYGYLIGIIVKLLTLLGINANNQTFENTAHLLTILCGIFTVFLLFVFIYKISKDTTSALIGSLICALSGIQIIWSGFIITDTLAGFILLLFLFIRLKNTSWIVNVALYLLLYLTRPEFIFIPFVVESLLYLIRILKKKDLINTLLRLQTVAFGIIYVFIYINSSLINRNYQADILLWLSLFIGVIVLVIKPKLLNIKDQEKIALILTFNITSILMVIYYWFNSDISRYINVILPLLTVISGLTLGKIYSVVAANNKQIKIFFAICTVLLLIPNIVYLINFNKPENIDYQTEIAQKVLEFANSNNYKTIYVGQEEAYLWEDEIKQFNIIPIDNITLDEIKEGSIYINDPSIPYVNSKFDQTNLESKGFKKLLTYTSKSPFRINNVVDKGWMEVWVKTSTL